MFLYELAQSVGQDLDPVNNCKTFASILLARRNLSYCGFWIRDELMTGEESTAARLYFAKPKRRALCVAVEDTATTFPNLPQSDIADNDDDRFEAATEGEVAATLPLGKIGWIRLRSKRPKPLPRRDLMQLVQAARKLGSVLEGAFAHQGLLREREQRNALEAQLRQAQKMEAIGRLAGGIAHDFNNILTSILGFAELGLMKLGSARNPELESFLFEIKTAGVRGRDVVAKLLTYASGNSSSRDAIDISTPVLETVRLLQPTLGASVKMRAHANDGVPPVFANDDEIAQICMNLCINAHDAIEKHGNIDIFIEHVWQPDFSCASCLSDVRAQHWVKLAVRDDAGGIDPDTRAHMFDPFYTTKGPGGSGLGLSTVHGLVHQHGGHLRVDTQLGKGSEFSVLLPVHAM